MEIIDANTVFGVWPKGEMDISLEKLVSIMKENNVSRFLSVSMKGIFYDYEEGNEETLNLSKKYPQIIPVATCDMRKYYGNKEFVKKLVEDGFNAIRLFPDFQNWPVSYEPLKVLIEELEKNPLPLIITALGPGFITALSNLYDESKFPVIIAGIGYGLYAEAISVMKKQKNFCLDTDFIDTPDGIEIFAREIGVERIVFGSYSPINYFRPSFLSLEKADLKDEEKLLIASGNIKRILGI